MGTVMIYNSTASTYVKPDIVELNISLYAFESDAASSVNKINENRQLVKDYIFRKTSYKPDSYHQNSLNINRRVNREFYYDDGSNKLTEDQYNNLPVHKRNNYTKKYIEKLIGYEATLTITATLAYSDTVVKDLVDIFNMATERNISCTYNHNISKSLRDTTMQQLYATCINDGFSNVQRIVNDLNTNIASHKTLTLLNVMDPAATSMRNDRDMLFMSEKKYNASIGSSYEPETIIMPELIEELFNNNIELTKSLDLKFEFA